MPLTVTHRPSVLISYSRDGADAPEWFRRALTDAGDRVVAELGARGVEALVENAARPSRSPECALDGADGLAVLGGADLDPAHYGARVEAELGFVDTAADAFELALVRTAIERALPVFGICRGMQVLNVARGGTLVQDLGTGVHNGDLGGDLFRNHEVRLDPSSIVAGLSAGTTIDVRTGHHQAVDRLGEGLRASAHAADGVIEAIECTEPWLLGVQWHPEEAEADPAALGLLLDGFIARLGSFAAVA